MANAKVNAEVPISTTELDGSQSGVWKFPGGDEPLTFAVHDAKNLACALMANATWLRAVIDERSLGASVSDALDDMVSGCERLSEVLGSALLVARGTEANVRVAPAHIGALVVRAVDQVRRHAAVRGVRLEVNASGPEVVANVDRRMLARVLENLLDNAIRFCRRDGRVAVQIGREGANVTLRVLDQGPGVPMDQRVRIFEPFVSVDAVHGAVGSANTGLGLAFCKQVVAAHGGEISVSDAPLGGACFAITIPSPEVP